MIRTVVQLVRALWYFTLAAMILAGLPWLLTHFVGWPLPRGVPDPVTLRDWFDNPFAGMRFWKLVSIIFWLLWAALVVFLARELLAQLGRIRVPRLRVRPLQGLAAGMLGATAVTVPAAAAQAAAPPAIAPATVPGLDRFTAATPAATPTELTYLVEHGDWLSSIAERFLGDRDAYPRIRDLNPRLDARGPSHLEPGWRLRLPGDARERGVRLHAAGKILAGAAQTPPPPPPAPPQPPSADPVTQPDPTPPGETSPAQPNQPAGASSVLDDDGPDVVIGQHRSGAMAGAGLLAALLFATLTAERRRQRSFLIAGQHPPMPRTGRAERELRAAQQPADVERLDAALRDLATSLSTRASLPDIAGVRLVGGDIHALLGHPDDNPPPPWLDEGTQWALPAYVELDATEQPPTLLPLLVTVGSRAGRHLLIDLQRLGTLSITGHPSKARDVLRHIVCELACATWAEGATILLVGFGDEGEPLADIGAERIHPMATLTEAIATVRAQLHQRNDPTTAAAPLILAITDPTAQARADLAELHQQLLAAGQRGVAVIATTGETIGAPSLTVAEDGLVTVDVPGLRLTTDAASVPVDLLDPMAQVFRAARLTTPAAPPATPEADTVDTAMSVLTLFDPTALFDPAALAPDTATLTGAPPALFSPGAASLVAVDTDTTLDDDLAAWIHTDPARPRLGILGPIQAHLPGQITDSKHRLYTEMLLYLLTRPDAATSRAEMEDALWYGNPAGDGTIRAAMARLRRWLGTRPDGTEWISEGTLPEGVYRLTKGILLDWQLLLRLRERGEHRGEAGIADYRAALQLLRGVPMRDRPDHGRYRRPYTWIGDADINPTHIIATVTDIAHRLATYSLDVGDTATTRWAVQRAWLVDPDRGYDELWIDHLRAEHHDGRTAAQQHLLAELLEHREAEVPEDLQPRTYSAIRPFLPDAT